MFIMYVEHTESSLGFKVARLGEIGGSGCQVFTVFLRKMHRPIHFSQHLCPWYIFLHEKLNKISKHKSISPEKINQHTCFSCLVSFI